jgi:hypothetical protein
MKRRIGIAITAMIVAAHLGRPVSADPPTLEQLTQMAALLEANDVAGLRAFLLRHPDLLEGDSSLTMRLREFLLETRDLSSYLSFEPDLRDAITREDRPEGVAAY